ncbi:MAG: hypothetical protein DWQ46_18240 [Planctomycetota bacterium]|nr:MAG: hypothetical protein DWQ46_18240 [Planctomycetota bacterium]
MAAEIWIGGKVPASVAPELCAVIASQCVATEWGDAHFAPESPQDLLDACKDTSGVALLWLCDDQARWGEFDALETFLREHGISYKRRSDGRYEYDAELIEYRPERDVVATTTNAEGEPIIPVSKLAAVDAVLDSAQQARSRSEMLAALQAAQQLLREQLPPNVPPLEPFSIVDDTE